MEKDLCKFYDNCEFRNKDISIYKDEKGNEFIFNTVNALLRVDYLELTKEEYTTLKFQQKVEDKEYNVININKPIPKNEITGKQEDKYTLVDREVAVRQIWNVSNAFGIIKSFTNKEEALEFVEERNKLILTVLKYE